MTRQQILQLSGLLNALSNSFKSDKIPLRTLYKLAKIKAKLDEEANAYKQVQEEILEIIKPFEQERIQLILQYAETDDKGQPKLNPDGSVQLKQDKLEEFQQKLNELHEKYKDQIELFNKKMKEFEDFMKEEVDLDLPKLKLSELPEDLPLTLAEMELLMLVVEDDEGEAQ